LAKKFKLMDTKLIHAEAAIENSRSKTALVTGASSGIGLELTKLFAKDEYSLVLVSRNHDALSKLGEELRKQNDVPITLIAKDLSVSSTPEEIYNELEEHAIQVDVLVNCAGLGASGFFSEIDPTTEASMIEVNVIALTKLTRLFLKGMLKRRRGGILNVASTAAFQPGPLMAVYYATKAYVLSFSEALAEEVRESGVVVTALCPGPTRTSFQTKAGTEQSRLFRGRGILDAETVARVGYEGFKNRKTVIIPGFINRLRAFGVRLAPRDWVTRVARRMNEKV
jgi:uncharacterized protein